MSNDDFIDLFINELEKNISIIEQCSIMLENEVNSGDINKVKFALHSIKGLFGFLDERFVRIKATTHHLEDRFSENINTSIDFLLVYVDLIRILIIRISKSRSFEVNVEDLFITLSQQLNPNFNLNKKFNILVTFNQQSDLIPARMLALISRLRKIATIISSIPDIDELVGIDDFYTADIVILSRENKYTIVDAVSKVPELISFEVLEVGLRGCHC